MKHEINSDNTVVSGPAINPFMTDSLKGNPFEVVQNYLPTRTLMSFTQTCQAAKNLTAKELEARMSYQLILAVVQGNQAKAEEIIKINPNLLLNTTHDLVDYSGKTIKNKTALQAALINFDIEMASMIKPYLLNLKNGKAELASQFHEIFPKGVEAHIQMLKSQAFDFSEIAEAIINATIDEVRLTLNENFDEKYELNKKLNNFRKKFDKISHSEEIFNPYHLLNAYRYVGNNFGEAHWPGSNLFLRVIIGYVQRHLPACFAQAFANGLCYIFEHGGKLKRSFSYHGHEDKYNDFFPLERLSGLGFSQFASSGFSAPIYHCQGRIRTEDNHFGIVVLSKFSSLASFCPQIAKATSCVRL